MEAVAVLAVVERGITIAMALLQAGASAAPALESIGKLIAGQREGTVTQEELEATERLLDSLITDFNAKF